MVVRCEWAIAEPMISYHDHEWGVPEHNDIKLLEFLILEGAQAGLSWMTILKKREGYRRAFSGFDAKKIAKYDHTHIQKLLNDESIIRNKTKIQSAINNARQFLTVQNEFGTFDRYIWSFMEHTPLKNRYEESSEIPSHIPPSQKMSADLKRRGFTFVGPIICYAFMQATGMVNDHIASCFRYGR